MERASTKPKDKGLHSSSNPASTTTATRNRLPRAPFSAYPKRLKLSDLSELSELSRLYKELGEPAESKPSAIRLSGIGTTEAPFEIPESPKLQPTSRPHFRYMTADDALDPEFSPAEMQFFGFDITRGEKEGCSGTTASPHELSSSSTPTLAPTPTHRGELRRLPRSSETPAPLASSLAHAIPATRRIIPTKGILLDSNTEDTYIYHHEIGAIISQDPVNKDSSQEEIILLVEVGAGLVAKANTANTIVICKSPIEVNRLGRSFDNDKWVSLVHPRVGKIWLFRIPHVRLLIGGRRPAVKCGICEGVIPEGKVAHGCVYTHEAVGDSGGAEPILSTKKVRFALKPWE